MSKGIGAAVVVFMVKSQDEIIRLEDCPNFQEQQNHRVELSAAIIALRYVLER
jgi:ribonuclease HI